MNEDSRAFVAGRRVLGRSLGWLVGLLAGGVLALWLKSSFAVVALVVAGIWILFSVFTLYFFRDPTAHVPAPATPVKDGALMSESAEQMACA